MGKYDAYRNRVKANGSSFQENILDSTKKQQIQLMMNSPTLSYVKLNNETEDTPSIVSNVETFIKRRFLFLPDTEVNVGDFIVHKEYTYLATDATKIEIYPELFGELCDEKFKIVLGKTRTIVDYDDFKRPIYDYVEDFIEVPCVTNTKIYSALSNSPIPLPAGAMIVKIPYSVDYKISINHRVKMKDAEYKVTDVKYDNVINEIGFIEINMQREVNKNDT